MDLILARVAWRDWVSVLQPLHPSASLPISVFETKLWEG